MDKKRIAVVYDTSYITGAFSPVKEFIVSRRFSSQSKPGFLGSLLSVFGGKGQATPGAEAPGQDAGSLFHVNEVIPAEIVNEVNRTLAPGEKEHKVVAGLQTGGAARVPLAMDTLVGDLSTGGQPRVMPPAPSEKVDAETDDKLLGYAARLVMPGTNDKYDLAIVATEDENLLSRVIKLAMEGQAVVGVKSGQLASTRILLDKLSEIASTPTSKITIQN